MVRLYGITIWYNTTIWYNQVMLHRHDVNESATHDLNKQSAFWNWLARNVMARWSGRADHSWHEADGLLEASKLFLS